ncbi:unnamed protein product [Blepharisma stoltei]|uniref:Protein kinase domain-containing protein n=1 Tax=Blepharisma stoltei TaxID=1481888 RepID=A0AAU9K1V5_9CILI|nr:unnamed protein product [Blepharisma stoltei]
MVDSISPSIGSDLRNSLKSKFDATYEEYTHADENQKLLYSKFFLTFFFNKVDKIEPEDIVGLRKVISSMASNSKDNLSHGYQKLFTLVRQSIKNQYDLFIANAKISEENKGEEAEKLVQDGENALQDPIKFLKSIEKWSEGIRMLEEVDISCQELKHYLYINLACLNVAPDDLKKTSELLKHLKPFVKFLEDLGTKDIITTPTRNLVSTINNYELYRKIQDASIGGLDTEALFKRVSSLNEEDIKESIRTVQFYDYSHCDLGDTIRDKVSKYSGEELKGEIQTTTDQEELDEETKDNVGELGAQETADNAIDNLSTVCPEADSFRLGDLEINSWDQLSIDSQIIPPRDKGNNVIMNVEKVVYNDEILVAKSHTFPSDFTKIKRFENEAKIMASASESGSSNFLRVYGAFHDVVNHRKKFTVVMEYCEGVLTNEIRERKYSHNKYSEEELQMFAISMINACSILADMKIYHRDIKPDNIFIKIEDDTKIYKLGDFDVSFTSETTSTEKTVSAGVTGTPDYLAPELFNLYLESLRLPTHRRAEFAMRARLRMSKADVYSLGLTILEMATLSSPGGHNSCDQEEIDNYVKAKVEIPWVKELLLYMLKVSYQERPDFRMLRERFGNDAPQATII